MVVELLTGEETLRALASLLRPEPTDDGFEPEARLVICGVSWERYLALDQALGDNRSGLSGKGCRTAKTTRRLA
jgi:hypothetical protein